MMLLGWQATFLSHSDVLVHDLFESSVGVRRMHV